MNHSFNIDVAAEVGVEAAIIFENIVFWVQKNGANGENVRDGRSWVYNSRAAWGELFPYLGEKQIRNALERLLSAGLVERDTFSFGSVNRTYWYTLAERAKPYLPKGPKLCSGQKGQTKTDIDNPINSTLSPRAKPTKASPRANPRISLVQFLKDSPGAPAEWLVWAVGEFGWNEERVNFEWDDFRDYWTSGNAAGGGLKSDWPATFRSHCRRVSGIKGRGPRPAGGTPGQGGGQRYDPVAAAKRRALAEMYGVGPEGHGGPPSPVDTSPCPFPDGDEAGEAVPVDAQPGDDVRLLPAPALDGGDSGGDVRAAVPVAVE